MAFERTSYFNELAKQGLGSKAEIHDLWNEACNAVHHHNPNPTVMDIMRLFQIGLERKRGEVESNVMDRGIAISANTRIHGARWTGKAAGIIFFCESTGRILLVKRSGTGDAGGTWCILGGGVDPGEDWAEAALREALEEGGFIGEVELDHIDDNVDPRDGFTYRTYWGQVDHEFNPILNDEHTEFKWVPYFGPKPQPLHPEFAKTLERMEEKEHQRIMNLDG